MEKIRVYAISTDSITEGRDFYIWMRAKAKILSARVEYHHVQKGNNFLFISAVINKNNPPKKIRFRIVTAYTEIFPIYEKYIATVKINDSEEAYLFVET